MLKRDASAGGDNRVQFVMRVLAVLLVICALWIFAFSVVNMMPGNTLLRVIISNFHFTVILCCVGLPRWMIRMRSTSTSKGTTEAKLHSSNAGGRNSESGRRLSLYASEKGARTSRTHIDIDKNTGTEENIYLVSLGSNFGIPPARIRRHSVQNP
ncbi:hypothetical protein BJ742DRAFT_800958 [Cladochytrium replicatum]|nr:hypothetical protein BJ742DRAFT_800958 [Cladochytrium replicatum]